MTARTAAFTLLLLALPLAACGTGGRESDVAAVAQRFHAALDAGNGQAACAELSDETASKLEREEKKPCAKAILAVELPKASSVTSTGVYVRSAYASLSEGDTDFLSEGPSGWAVSAAGCRRKAADQPYNCELEG